MTTITFKSLCIIKKYPAPIIFRVKHILKKDGEFKEVDYKKIEHKAAEYKNTDCKVNLCTIWIRKNF